MGERTLLDPAVQQDPYPYYAELRRSAPVFRMPETGFYLVTRYPDVVTVLRDAERFSNDIAAVAGPARSPGPAARDVYAKVLQEGIDAGLFYEGDAEETAILWQSIMQMQMARAVEAGLKDPIEVSSSMMVHIRRLVCRP